MSERKLGFGLMRLPRLDDSDAAAIDLEQTKQMVDAFLEKGFTYFDTAWMYCAFKSEEAVKEVLVKRHPRDRFSLATKLHSGFVHSLEDRDRIFEEQRRKTGVEYFDYYLLHGIGGESYQVYQQFDCFAWLEEKKRQGLVKHIGFSFHDHADVLERILKEHPEMEFVQLQINYLDWDSQGVQARKCYETAVRFGKPVIVMEPVKGGTLANVPEKVEQMFRQMHPDWSPSSWAIRFAASLENVKLVLSGMSNLAQLQDNIGYMEHFQPLTAEEQSVVHKAVEIINQSIAIPCTGCAYCTEGCPQNIPIPQYFSLYNADLQEAPDKGWLPQQSYYQGLTLKHGKASQCIGCGQCEGVCPQHLPIIEDLKLVAQRFEG